VQIAARKLKKKRLLSSLTDGTRAWVLLAAALTLAYSLWTIFANTALPGRYLVTQALYFPVGAIALLIVLRLVRGLCTSRRYAAAWGLVGAALAIFWLGDALWVGIEVARGEVESPNWADALYLAYYPLLLAGLVLMSGGTQSRAERARVWLDIATMSAGGAVLVWHSVLGPALRDFALSLADVISLSYSLGDLALMVGIAFLLARRSRVCSPWTLLLLLAGVLVGFVADLAYGYVLAMAEFVGGGLIDVLYVLSFFLLGSAAAAEYRALGRRASGQPEEGADRVEPTGELRAANRGLPYAAISVAVLMWIWALYESLGTGASPAVIAAAVVTGLAAARHVLAVRENVRLRETEARRASEERLRENLRRTQFLVDHAPDIILWLDEQGWIVEANEAASVALGYSKAELIGLPMTQVDAGMGDRPEEWTDRWESLVREGQRTFETIYQTKDGATVPVEVKSGYLQYEGKEYCCSFVRDISDRKRSEAALREAEAQLRQSQKMEAIGQLAGGIAHDFNNLLTAILGYSDLILGQGDRLDPEVREDVAEIRTAADRAALLTRQILAFSRRQPLEAKLVQVNELVTDTARILSRTLGEDVDLVLRLHPEAGLAQVDPAQFTQVILNLAVNARDAMPNGGTLTMETAPVVVDEAWCSRHSALRPGPHVMLAVSDTGCGMDEETKARAFEPFFTTKAAGKGTGLGLSTVYGTVSQSDGAVLLYSEPGHGTTVKVYLPRAQAPQRKKGEGAGEARAGDWRAGEYRAGDGRAGGDQTGDEQGRGGAILVVEDEAWIRELVVKVLEARGHPVVAVGTAEEALTLIEGDHTGVDLLLIDLVLPGPIQGPVLAERARSYRPGMPVVFMSGYSREAILSAGWTVGSVGYLEKPFTPEQLLSEVESVLGSSQSGIRSTPGVSATMN